MGTDFFDEDLVREREAALKIKLNGEVEVLREMASFRLLAICRTVRSPI